MNDFGGHKRKVNDRKRSVASAIVAHIVFQPILKGCGRVTGDDRAEPLVREHALDPKAQRRDERRKIASLFGGDLLKMCRQLVHVEIGRGILARAHEFDGFRKVAN